MTPDTAGGQDVKSYLRILWRWKLLFVAVFVVVPLGTYLFERGRHKLYQSSALIQPLNTSASPDASSSAGATPVAAAARLVTTTPVAETAATLLSPSASPAALLKQVSASPDTTTGFITITAQDPDAYRAAAIANAFSAALGKREQREMTQAVNAELGSIVRQLASTPRPDASQQASLQQEIGTLRTLRGGGSGGAQLIQAAVPSASPAVPNTRQAVAIAAVIGLLLAAGAVLIAENSDRRLRTPEAAERLTGLPLIGTLPPSAFSPNRGGSARDEVFQMLRAALAVFNDERALARLAVVSPAPQEGKTTVAVGLALAIVRAGSRVVLVDADLRRREVCARLGIKETPGLGAVLANDCELSDAVVEVPVESPEAGRLLVLPAGPARTNPAALLSTPGMPALLKRLDAEADLVIVDTPAALAVGDAISLLEDVSGVVMVVRMNHSSRAAVARLQSVISTAGGRLMGLVATACRQAEGYESYRYYQASLKHAQRRTWREVAYGRPPGSAGSSTNGAPQDSGAESVATRASLSAPVTTGQAQAAGPGPERNAEPTPGQSGAQMEQASSPSQRQARWPNGGPSAGSPPGTTLDDPAPAVASVPALERGSWRKKVRNRLSRFG